MPRLPALRRFAFSRRRAMACGMHGRFSTATQVETKVAIQANVKPRAGAGSIYSFVPAHSGSRAAAVAGQVSRSQRKTLGPSVLLANFDARGYSPWRLGETLRRLDGHTWGALVSDVDGVTVLEANEVHPQQLRPVLEYARSHYSVVCADLTSARESFALEVLRASDGIFLVAGSDPQSLEGARDKRDWLRSLDLADRCGLLLSREREGANPSEAEEITGVPVCSLIETEKQIDNLAAWLAAGINRKSDSRDSDSNNLEYAVAV
jgi:Flp pilus assembly CpaE family ATPase